MSSMLHRADVVVVGAGVVGLAIAARLACAGREVIVLEREEAIGTGISSRGSEVVHAGVYYPAASLKTLLCRRGRDLLYDFCKRYDVDHQVCGKLIVADWGGAEQLRAIAARGYANGVDDLQLLASGEAAALEPELSCQLAILSPSTGIVDSRGFMLALQGLLEDAGGTIAFATPVIGGAVDREGVRVATGGAQPTIILAGTLVNAAGLGAAAVARRFDAGGLPAMHMAKGSYFTLAQASPFGRLIYPVPEPGGLGIHLTLDLGGQARFGPDVEWVDRIDYVVDPAKAETFAASIRSYWPGVDAADLRPGYSGIRPKLLGPGKPDADFLIMRQDRSAIHLLGIESPGFTASLAIAEEVEARLA